MGKKSVAEKVEWMKATLSEMLMVACDDEDQAHGSALKILDDLEGQMSEWMEAHYGDQE